MTRALRWYDHITINVYWFALSVASATITPLLLPYLVALYVPAGQKNTYLSVVRSIGLAVAMMVQPIAGLLSDRNTSRWGRRRPFIFGGTMGNLLFLLVVGASTLFADSSQAGSLQIMPYGVLLGGIVLLQISSNTAHGALQGFIPDLVPEQQRGRASGIKTVIDLMPIFLAIFIGPLVDAGRIWLTVGIVMATFFLCMLVTILFVDEGQLRVKPTAAIAGPILRLVALTAIFVGVTEGAVWLVGSSGTRLAEGGVAAGQQVAVVGVVGLVGMAVSIFLGVYFGAWVGIGKGARQQTSFIWWVINRLLFLAAVGSIQGFAQFFLSDYLQIENAADATAKLMAAVGVFLIPSALGGGYLADRIGRKRLLALASLLAAGGTLLLLFSNNFTLVLISGCIIGLGSGTFLATSWALGTDLAPPAEAGRYLGISNLAGAGAGIVGTRIGGPIADSFNALQPGLGYLVVFAMYGGLFLLAIVSLAGVKKPGLAEETPP